MVYFAFTFNVRKTHESSKNKACTFLAKVKLNNYEMEQAESIYFFFFESYYI